jgi:hypothetical protein
MSVVVVPWPRQHDASGLRRRQQRVLDDFSGNIIAIDEGCDAHIRWS